MEPCRTFNKTEFSLRRFIYVYTGLYGDVTSRSGARAKEGVLPT